jgi:protein-L-isoaspartate(D-aspartate) O-methyltransferase
MEDTYRHKGMRRRLIEVLKEKGIKDEKVLDAFYQVPRHFFLDKAFEELAYEDKAMPIGEGQTISQPYTVAYQTQLLEVEKRDKVLEIGTGSGYQAAILGALGVRLHTIERHEALYQSATAILRELGLINVRTYFRDGNKGLGEFAPFDRILVTCGIEEVPNALLEQLTVGGYLVIPLGDATAQRMIRIKKVSATEFEEEQFDYFRFVPFLKGKKPQ